MSQETSLQSAGNFIAGAFVPARSGQEYERRNPADERETVAVYPRSAGTDVDDALTAAVAGHERWRALPGPQRAQVLHRAGTLLEEQAEEATREIVLEEGKTFAEASAEVARTLVVFRFFAEQARSIGGRTAESEEAGTVIYTRRRPLGVVVAITPWNFPLALPAWKCVPALAFGNAVVCKPASHAPGPTLRLARLLAEAGVPDGAFNVVIGTGGDVGDALINDPRVAAVSFTGSTAVGRRLESRLGQRGVRFQGELGGHSPMIVAADADLTQATTLTCESAFGSAGQRCTATRRVIVEEAVYDEFVEQLAEATRGIVVGNGLTPEARVPPLVSSKDRDAVRDAVEKAVADGARMVCGDEPLDSLDHGAFMRPTVLADVSPDHEVAQTEVFGPVCSVLKARDFQHAIAVANEVRYGLSASVLTRDIGRVLTFVDRIDSGMVHVNRPTIGGDPHMPFGGLKASGTSYREWGEAAGQFFTEEQTVYVRG
jgi:acyl-CoA reductase-like NAD-dependent aldehyde dehydrogenase